LEFSGERENEVQYYAKKFTEYLTGHNQQKRFIILGPADAAIPKIKNVFRKHVVIKNLKDNDPSGAYLRSALLKTRAQFDTSPLAANKKIKMIIDVDPQGMM
jgi:primosomal protein N'